MTVCVILTGNEAAPWVLEDEPFPESACISGRRRDE